jgi:hypothetical protein
VRPGPPRGVTGSPVTWGVSYLFRRPTKLPRRIGEARNYLFFFALDFDFFFETFLLTAFFLAMVGSPYLRVV